MGTWWKEKAIYAYPTIHYSFWEKELEKNPLPYGLFDQNLDIDGEFVELPAIPKTQHTGAS